MPFFLDITDLYLAGASQKKCPDGIEFCKRKVAMLNANSQELLKLMREKQEVAQQVQRVLQAKIAQAQAQEAEAAQ